MRLAFLDRAEELERLRRLCDSREGALAVLYGRRRCGKSRLILEAIAGRRAVYYVGDDRESAHQRASLASEIASVIAGFDRVTYRDWDSLLDRWWDGAGRGTVLVLDEFPSLVATAPELPSLIQKRIDRRSDRGVHLVLAGSSQRMMQGLVLDRTAPLFGRAREVMRIPPLRAGWVQRALPVRDPARAVEAYAIWGGTPRYWELAAEFDDPGEALRSLVLSPLGVLHDEPFSLLIDDLRDTAQAASILSLIGRGCHRLSEISARLGKPATSLSRPLQRLQELEYVRREVPFGSSTRDSKRTLYRIADPFLRFWFRYVEPGRSRLEAGRVSAVERDISRTLSHHVGGVWEDLARESVPRLELLGRAWGPAARWWGAGLDRKPMEIDVVSESEDGKAILVGEATWDDAADAAGRLDSLARRARNLPLAQGREVCVAVWLKSGRAGRRANGACVTPKRVLPALR